MNMRFGMLKRDLRLFMGCLLSAAVLTAAFAAVCAAAAFSGASSAGSAFSPVKTAVVDGEDSLMSRLVVNTVAHMDYISDLMEVTVCPMEEAMEGLRDGTYAAVITLPEGVVDGILSGQNTKGTVYLSAAAAAHAEVVAKAAAFGEVMLAAGQYGIFSGEALIREHALGSEFRREFLSRYNGLLLSEALSAGSEYFKIQITDYADTHMSLMGYYIVSWLTFLVLLIPMLFAGLYTRDLHKPILCRLRGLGVTDSMFLLGKFLFPFVFMAVFTAGALAAVSAVTQVHVTLTAVLWAVLGVFTAAVCGGCMMLVVSRGVPLVAAVCTAGLLLCGGLIPRPLLPKAVLQLGALTPFGAVQNCFLPIFGGKVQVLPLAAAAGYGVVLLWLVKRRLLRIRIGGDEA